MRLTTLQWSPGIMSDKALELLHALTGPHGIRASLSTTANYDAVFTRDAAMAGIAGLLAGDEQIAAGLVRTLTHLRDLPTDIEKNEASAA